MTAVLKSNAQCVRLVAGRRTLSVSIQKSSGFQLLLKNADISQDSVAIRFSFGGIFNANIIKNFPAYSESEKSVKLGQYFMKL